MPIHRRMHEQMQGVYMVEYYTVMKKEDPVLPERTHMNLPNIM